MRSFTDLFLHQKPEISPFLHHRNWFSNDGCSTERLNMPISTETLASIQSAGAAVFAADEHLKTTVAQYAKAVPEALENNPFDLGTDVLFENWKTVARISKAMSQLETEVKKLYDAAAVISDTTHNAPAIEAPKDVPLEVIKALETATDAVIKKPAKEKAKDKVVKVKATATPVANSIPRNMASRASAVKVDAPVSTVEVAKESPGPKPTKKPKASKIAITGNTLKLLDYLKTVLNAKTFIKVNQSEAAVSASISKGSIGASFNKLVATSHLIAGKKGEFKLAS